MRPRLLVILLLLLGTTMCASNPKHVMVTAVAIEGISPALDRGTRLHVLRDPQGTDRALHEALAREAETSLERQGYLLTGVADADFVVTLEWEVLPRSAGKQAGSSGPSGGPSLPVPYKAPASPAFGQQVGTRPTQSVPHVGAGFRYQPEYVHRVLAHLVKADNVPGRESRDVVWSGTAQFVDVSQENPEVRRSAYRILVRAVFDQFGVDVDWTHWRDRGE